MIAISEVLPSLDPCVSKYVESLIFDGKAGISPGTIKVCAVGRSCTTAQRSACNDRLQIQIPYGGQSITWEVIFNHHQPTEPPDFILNDEKFLPDIGNIKSLLNWDAGDATSLLSSIQELLEEYKVYQQSLLQDESYSRLQFEYNSLTEQGNYKQQDIEILVSKRNEIVITHVSFLVKLRVDFTGIPAYLVRDYPGDDSAVLSVIFQIPDTNKVTTQLHLSPRVEHALGGMRALKLPSFPSGTCLIDYVPDVCTMLENKVKQAQQNFAKRSDYIAAFLSQYGRSVIEHDSEEFASLSLLLMWHDFSFIIIIELPLHFPMDQPVFTFQSVYHETSGGVPFNATEANYPYSPRWTPGEMANRAGLYWIDYISKFQQCSIRDGAL